MDEKTLEELAVQEILKDLKRGAERAKEHGALGWQRNPAPPPNKRFLRNMLVSTLRDNRPFKPKPDSQSHHPHPSHRDSAPRRTSESEAYFRYNDRYHQSKTSHDSGNNHRKNVCPSSQEVCSNGHGSESQAEEGKHSGKTVQESEPQSAEQEIDISDFNHKSQYWKKRARSSSSDCVCLEVEENEEENEEKKRKTERHRKTDLKDDKHSGEKKKHKKSKKSKKHKSKHSRHRSDH